MKVSHFLSGFANLFYPKVCAVCHTDLVVGEEVICIECLQNMPLTRYWNSPVNPVSQLFWGRVSIENACAYFLFSKGSKYRPLLHKLKYNGYKEIGIALGAELGYTLNRTELYKGIDFIVPVPLHPKKLKIRGYNQAEVIAQGLSKGLGSPVSNSLLMRTEFTQTQTRKSRIDRVKNVANAFAISQDESLQGKHLLLVDDVITTGATLEACAQQLLQIEGCKVSIAALAYASS